MNIMQMVQQAQKMQKKLKEAQDELAKTELTVESANGAIAVTCDGQGKIKGIKIKAEALNPENPEIVDADMLETLEDLVLTAVQGAQKKAATEMETKMKALTGGINIPGLF